MAGGDLPAEHGDAGGADGNDEGGAMGADIHAGERADVDVFRVGRARVHADLAAEDDPGVGLADGAQGDALGRVRRGGARRWWRRRRRT